MSVSPAPRPAGTPAGRWFPHPLLSLLLGVSWLLLSASLAPAHLLAALLIGWGVPRLVRPFLGPASRVAWAPACALAVRVLWDIVVSNITVARLVLGPQDRLQPAWLRVPLATDHPLVNSLLASIITTTPGTVSATLDEARREILVHALDCTDVEAAVRDIKQRYEAPLMRIFQAQPRSGQGG